MYYKYGQPNKYRQWQKASNVKRVYKSITFKIIKKANIYKLEVMYAIYNNSKQAGIYRQQTTRNISEGRYKVNAKRKQKQ